MIQGGIGNCDAVHSPKKNLGKSLLFTDSNSPHILSVMRITKPAKKDSSSAAAATVNFKEITDLKLDEI